MEQEHGTDAAAICKGVLLRIGMAAAMSTAVLGFLSYHVLPRLRMVLVGGSVTLALSTVMR